MASGVGKKEVGSSVRVRVVENEAADTEPPDTVVESSPPPVDPPVEPMLKFLSAVRGSAMGSRGSLLSLELEVR